MTSYRQATVWAAALALGAMLGCPPAGAQERTQLQAQPQESLNLEIIVLHATNDGRGIDKTIGEMPELARPPFSAYNSYKLLQREKVTLGLGKTASHKLPNARLMAVAFKNVIAPRDPKKDQPKYTVSASIQKPRAPDYLPLLEVNARKGERFFVAGQVYQGGVLVIGIKLLP